MLRKLNELLQELLFDLSTRECCDILHDGATGIESNIFNMNRIMSDFGYSVLNNGPRSSEN